MPPLRLIALAPGHFHAALIQKEMLRGIEPQGHVYGPLDEDLVAHLQRIVAFNRRAVNPTAWNLEVHAGDDWRQQFLRETPGSIVIVSGRNRSKIEIMQLAVQAGMHVLADKPWIIEPENLARLAATLEKAARAGLLVRDIMTERFEITSILQREIVNDADVFGAIELGDAGQPAVFMESIHYLKKQVAGAPLRRPGWFFDTAEQGEALADVGTHLVDQVMWMLCKDDPIDYAKDIQILDGQRWPTVLDQEQFRAVTGLSEYPAEVRSVQSGGRLEYFCNNRVDYQLRGICVRLDVLWDFEAPPGGGDTHNATFRGTLSSAVIRQSGGTLPELLIAPNEGQRNAVRAALERRVEAWQEAYPGIRIVAGTGEFQINIPDIYRTSHEAHFAEVASQFLRDIESARQTPSWEVSQLLAKYFVTTQGVALARQRSKM